VGGGGRGREGEGEGEREREGGCRRWMVGFCGYCGLVRRSTDGGLVFLRHLLVILHHRQVRLVIHTAVLALRRMAIPPSRMGSGRGFRKQKHMSLQHSHVGAPSKIPSLGRQVAWPQNLQRSSISCALPSG